MSHDKIGPKQAQLQALKRAQMERSKKPSAADLRNKIAKIKPMAKHGGRRGR